MRREQAALLGALAVGVLALALYASTYNPEPAYEGKELSRWLLTRAEGRESLSVELQRVHAICVIGSNAVPYLLRWTAYEREPWKRAALRLAPTLGFLRRQEELANASLEAFRIIGSEAQSAVPELARMTQNTNFIVAERARCSIDAIEGREFRVPLQHRGFRLTSRMGALRLGGEGGVKDLVEMLQFPTPVVAEGAAIALTAIGPEPGVVKALTNAFETTNPHLRSYVVAGLGRFGADSIPAVPCLIRALSDPHNYVREAATNSLRRLAKDTMGTVRAP